MHRLNQIVLLLLCLVASAACSVSVSEVADAKLKKIECSVYRLVWKQMQNEQRLVDPIMLEGCDLTTSLLELDIAKPVETTEVPTNIAKDLINKLKNRRMPERYITQVRASSAFIKLAKAYSETLSVAE